MPRSSEGHVYRGPLPYGHWIDAGDLKPGYRLLNPDRSWAVVEAVRVEAKPLTAYNITVADTETYFVRGAGDDDVQPVWVHNCSKRMPPHVRDAIDRGNKAHAELKAKVKAKDGWKSEPYFKGADGRVHRPDALTKNGYCIELKPNTPSGRRAGKSQAARYTNQTPCRRTRVVYYDP